MKIFNRLWMTVAGILCLAYGLFGCAGLKVKKAQEPALRTLITSGYDIAAVLNAAEKETEDLYFNKLVTADEARVVGLSIGKATDVDQQFIARLNTLRSVDPSNRAQVAAWIAELTGSVGTLVDQGDVGVKNAQARTRIHAALSGLQLIVNRIADVLNAIPAFTSEEKQNEDRGRNSVVGYRFLAVPERIGACASSARAIRLVGRGACGQSHGVEPGDRRPVEGISHEVARLAHTATARQVSSWLQNAFRV